MAAMPSMPSGRGRPGVSKIRRAGATESVGLLTAILVALSLVTFTLSVREHDAGFFTAARNVTQTMAFPLRMAGAALTAPFSGLSNVMRNLTADEQTLSELKLENERLVARNVELEEAVQTVQQLRELLELRDSYRLQSVAASVIAGSTDSWTNTVTIDKGTLAGLSVGMPVVAGEGAVGQLISCSATTSVVRLLADEGSSVSAMLQSSRAQGMLEGAQDSTLHLSFIRTDLTVNVGETVVTGGLGGVFPKGLPLGKVSSVETAAGSTYYTITVEPFSSLSNLEQVLVVTSLTEESEADAQDIARADALDRSARPDALVSEEDGSDEAAQSSVQDDSDTMAYGGDGGSESALDTASQDTDVQQDTSASDGEETQPIDAGYDLSRYAQGEEG